MARLLSRVEPFVVWLRSLAGWWCFRRSADGSSSASGWMRRGAFGLSKISLAGGTLRARDRPHSGKAARNAALSIPTIPMWIAPAVPNAASPTRRLSFSRNCSGEFNAKTPRGKGAKMFVWKLRVEADLHPKAARYWSWVKPCTRPDATSSMRRTPSATASLTDAGSITLSTRRRANSKRSSGDNSSAASDNSVELLAELYALSEARRVGFR